VILRVGCKGIRLRGGAFSGGWFRLECSLIPVQADTRKDLGAKEWDSPRRRGAPLWRPRQRWSESLVHAGWPRPPEASRAAPGLRCAARQRIDGASVPPNPLMQPTNAGGAQFRPPRPAGGGQRNEGFHKSFAADQPSVRRAARIPRTEQTVRVKPLNRSEKLDGYLAFQRYAAWAFAMRAEGGRHGASMQPPSMMESEHPLNSEITITGGFFAHWLAGLEVVLEGWEALGLADPEINGLLQSEERQTLRLFRHGVYHFHVDILKRPFAPVMGGSDETLRWADKLSRALRRFIEERRAKPALMTTWIEDHTG
jgi:hypothetical protein